jgi:hypothetical protein
MIDKCLDCRMHMRGSGEYYVVTDKVWKEAVGMSRKADKSELCIGCLESRLGRQLTRDDFTACDVNYDVRFWPKSDRLFSRMFGEEWRDITSTAVEWWLAKLENPALFEN